MEGNKLSQATVISMLKALENQLTVGESKSSSSSSSNSCTPKLESKPAFLSRGRGRGVALLTNNNRATISNTSKQPKPVLGCGRGFFKPVSHTVNRSEDIYKNTTSNIATIHANPPLISPVFGEISKDAPTNSPEKSVICNAVRIESGHVFEYTPCFKPDVDLTSRRLDFLNKHFKSIAKTFFYDGSSVYVSIRLQNEELGSSRCSQLTKVLVKLTLEFKQTTALENHPELLRVVLEHAFNSALETDSQVKIFSSYMAAVHNTPNGILLYADRRHYLVEAESVAEKMLELERRFHERLHEAVKELLIETLVYYALDDKMYRLVGVDWTNRFLELDANGFQRIANPENCKRAEIIEDIMETPSKLMSDLRGLFSSRSLQNEWNFMFGPFVKAKARVLKTEKIVFGDAVECAPHNGSWEESVRSNEFLISAELCFWVIFHMETDLVHAEVLTEHVKRLGDDAGMSIGKPLLVPIASDSREGYVNALRCISGQKLQLVVVITPQSPNMPQKLIKQLCCIWNPVPCQIIRSSDVTSPLKTHEITTWLSVKLGGIPWTVKFPHENGMVCGIDLCRSEKASPVCSFVATLTGDATQWYSKAVFVNENFAGCLRTWLIDVLGKYRDTNGIYPSQLVVYQNCSEEFRAQLAEDYAGFDFNGCFQQLRVRNVEVCVVFVRKDALASFYKDLRRGIENVPPGTVVDNTITNSNGRDFFLTSGCAPGCMIARPTHYETIRNTFLTPDQVQMFTYKMCHLYYGRARTVEVPAPCLYAEKLSRLVRDINAIPSDDLNECLYYI